MLAPPDTTKWWTNRRRLAYLSMLGLFVLIAVTWAMPPEQINAATAILTAVAWMFGLVLGTYVGAATVEDITKIKAMMK